MRRLCMILLSLTALGCGGSQDGSEQADEAATAWAEAYFNYDFRTAARLTTPESRKWLRFAASNVTEADVKILRQQEEAAQVELTGCEQTDDSTWTGTVEVVHFLQADSMGRAGRMVEETEVFTIPMVCRNGRMYVKMAGLPRSEKRSHD